MSRFTLLVSGCVIALLLIVVLWDPRNRAYFFSPIGHADDGSLLGVIIGNPRQSAEHPLGRYGFSFSQTTRASCGTHAHTADVVVDIYEDHTWRSGVVCVEVLNGKIVGLEVQYQGPELP